MQMADVALQQERCDEGSQIGMDCFYLFLERFTSKTERGVVGKVQQERQAPIWMQLN